MADAKLEKWLVACLMILVLCITSAVAAMPLRTEEGFFEFAVLGPDVSASSYPYNVTVTQSVQLWIFVANRMPEAEHLMITMKIGIQDAEGEKLALVEESELDLRSGESRTVMFTFSLSRFGFHEAGSYRVIFELHRDTHISSAPSWQSTGLWLQVWLNVIE